MILNIQEIVLDQCLDPSVLQRIQNQELQSDPGSDPLKIAEIFRTLSDGIFTEVASPPVAGSSPLCDLHDPAQPSARIRQAAEQHGPRAQERSAVRPATAFIVFLGNSSSIPRMPRTWRGCTSMRSARRSTNSSSQKDRKIDDTTLAHLKEIRFRIDNVLKAGLNANEP